MSSTSAPPPSEPASQEEKEEKKKGMTRAELEAHQALYRKEQLVSVLTSLLNVHVGLRCVEHRPAVIYEGTLLRDKSEDGELFAEALQQLVLQSPVLNRQSKICELVVPVAHIVDDRVDPESNAIVARLYHLYKPVVRHPGSRHVEELALSVMSGRTRPATKPQPDPNTFHDSLVRMLIMEAKFIVSGYAKWTPDMDTKTKQKIERITEYGRDMYARLCVAAKLREQEMQKHKQSMLLDQEIEKQTRDD